LDDETPVVRASCPLDIYLITPKSAVIAALHRPAKSTYISKYTAT